MKKISILLLLMVLSSILAAQTDVKFDAQIRPRAELDDRDFFKDNDMSTITYLRTRFGAMFTSGSDIEAYLQFQDSRYYGQEKSTTVDMKNVDIHQAYFKIKDLFGLPLDVKAGRMEANYGTQRLVGAVGWSNVGRSFDGGVVTLKLDKTTFDFFTFQESENLNPGDTLDMSFTGIHVNINPDENLSIQPYLYLQSMVPSTTLSRFTLGTLLKGNVKGLFGELEAAYQFGKTTPVITELDIAAYLVAVNAGYNFDSKLNPYISAGVEMLSGDENAADDKYEAFNTLYATNHKYYGYMDYFINIPASTFNLGLSDIHVKAGFTPFDKFGVDLAIHMFNTLQDFTLISGDTSTDLGTEVDLTLKYKYNKNVNFNLGVSLFGPGDIFKQTRGEDGAFWSYFMTTVTL